MDINENMALPQVNSDTVNLYQTIYKSAQMGMGSLGTLLGCCDYNRLDEILAGQRRGYTAILRDAANALALCGIRPMGISTAKKIKTCLLIRCTAAKSCDNACIAGFVIADTTLRTIEGAKARSNSPFANDESKALMERLLRFEDANCRRLREFL